MERLFIDGANLTIHLRFTLELMQGHLYRPDPSSWSTGEPAGEVPPSYQDVVEGRIESKLVDPEMLPLKELPLDCQSGEPTPNIFTSRVNASRGRGLLDANVAHIPQR